MGRYKLIRSFVLRNEVDTRSCVQPLIGAPAQERWRQGRRARRMVHVIRGMWVEHPDMMHQFVSFVSSLFLPLHPAAALTNGASP